MSGDQAADTTAAADARFRHWMRGNLAYAADRFGLTVTGEPVLGWRLRTAQIVAAARLLTRAAHGDHPELAAPSAGTPEP